MKTLALDIGGVCLTLDFPRAMRYFGLDPSKPFPMEWMALNDDYNNGVIGSWQFAEGIQRLTGNSFTHEQIHDGWNLVLGEEIQETTKLLDHLWDNGWRIVFFSDTQPWHIERLRDILSYSKRIPEAIFSCDVGAAKPSSAMYEAFERSYGVPDLYLDDRQMNIDAGLARGWRAVRVEPGVCTQLLNGLE
ncbi:MAG: hypothetical protein J6X55_07950 [Victivallales bacterium]|nr:hypothetical protein [Victivallales bacterium]